MKDNTRPSAGSPAARVSAEIIERAALLASAYPAARRLLLGPTLQDATYRWLPSLASQLVRNTDDPENGFATEAEAIAAATKYRDGCAAFVIREARESSPSSSEDR